VEERYPNYSNEMGGCSGLTKHVLSSIRQFAGFTGFS
jgi:hypothetical protein